MVFIEKEVCTEIFAPACFPSTFFGLCVLFRILLELQPARRCFQKKSQEDLVLASLPASPRMLSRYEEI